MEKNGSHGLTGEEHEKDMLVMTLCSRWFCIYRVDGGDMCSGRRTTFYLISSMSVRRRSIARRKYVARYPNLFGLADIVIFVDIYVVLNDRVRYMPKL